MPNMFQNLTIKTCEFDPIDVVKYSWSNDLNHDTTHATTADAGVLIGENDYILKFSNLSDLMTATLDDAGTGTVDNTECHAALTTHIMDNRFPLIQKKDFNMIAPSVDLKEAISTYYGFNNTRTTDQMYASLQENILDELINTSSTSNLSDQIDALRIERASGDAQDLNSILHIKFIINDTDAANTKNPIIINILFAENDSLLKDMKNTTLSSVLTTNNIEKVIIYEHPRLENASKKQVHIDYTIKIGETITSKSFDVDLDLNIFSTTVEGVNFNWDRYDVLDIDGNAQTVIASDTSSSNMIAFVNYPDLYLTNEADENTISTKRIITDSSFETGRTNKWIITYETGETMDDGTGTGTGRMVPVTAILYILPLP